MPTYNTTRILAALAVFITVVLCYILGLSYWWLLAPVILYLAALFYGSYFIHSGMHLQAICSGPADQKSIALTFDDGPHAEVTPAILEVLKEYNAPATFFCIGKQVLAHPEVLRQVVIDGHLVGNHSYHHGKLFDIQGTQAMKQELDNTDKAIEEATGKKVKYFRPPYGVTNPNLAKAVKETGHTVVGWSLRSMDTTSKDPEALAQKLKSRIKPGDIVLLHDTQFGTISALKNFLAYCREQNYRIVPLDELIKMPAYE